MKKFLTLILAVLYMGPSTGATFHMHYCMGKLVGMELWHVDNNKCSKCGTEAHKICAKKCCKDEHKTVKLEKDQKATEDAVHQMQLIAVATPVSYIGLPQVHFVSVVEAYPICNAPPRSDKVHLHILNCTFRI
ncbi:HYC_CC_PP family protein [Chitinophaga sp. 30R24]|uniref:HYC_CC_PP family protein n=1 Tax=Chitinophaga sp. 30R24 TaxID=3248838 RepID=UPI003B8ED270